MNKQAGFLANPQILGVCVNLLTAMNHFLGNTFAINLVSKKVSDGFQPIAELSHWPFHKRGSYESAIRVRVAKDLWNS
jgi:hypothetical protein